MVHIGIDKNIVKKYQLAHWEKERVVDLICSLAFENILNNYKLQSKGEKRLDAFVNNEISSIVKELPNHANNRLPKAAPLHSAAFGSRLFANVVICYFELHI